MRSLTVEAKSEAGARALFSALSPFSPELGGDEQEGYRVIVPLNGSDHQVVALLGAIESFVANRKDGPARVELDGRRYTLAAAEPSQGAET
jgi:hypothetical protein